MWEKSAKTRTDRICAEPATKIFQDRGRGEEGEGSDVRKDEEDVSGLPGCLFY